MPNPEAFPTCRYFPPGPRGPVHFSMTNGGISEDFECTVAVIRMHLSMTNDSPPGIS